MKNDNQLAQLTKELTGFKDSEKGKFLLRFFKTGKGQYGEGDVFLGISVPKLRIVAKKYIDLSLSDIQTLLVNKIHEFRLVALFILVDKYNASASHSTLREEPSGSDSKSSGQAKKEIADFYLKNTKHVNNWDLVDSSAGYILGDYLLERDKTILYKLARSENIWERRIAIIATQGFISKNKFDDTLKIATILLSDRHDLIHKAVGWMLREVGNRDLKAELKFLDKHYQKMPRTMLRYAIEKFEKEKKEFYMRK